MFQSTHPQGVRPIYHQGTVETLIVSIHAPARGATVTLTAKTVDLTSVSIHAPARGATMEGKISFDSETVSIHAPARGATTSYITIYISRN